MMPNAVKGSDIKKLLWYLAGPGRENEHTNPRVLAGDFLTMSVYGGAIDQKRAWELGKLLDSPRQSLLRGEPVLTTSYKQARALMAQGMSRKAAFEAATRDENTWHCSLALRAEEGQLPMEKWAAIATDFMREMGYIGREDGAPDARWAVVHHGLSKKGNDHVHIAMPVVRPDGSLADMFRDRPRAQAASRILEERYGLQVLYTREHGDTERATKPAERARAARVGAPETDREALRRRVRGAAMAAESEAEWLRLMHAEGITVIPYWAPGGMDEVTGYKVEARPQKNLKTGAWEKTITYSGLRLGRDMTLPTVRKWAPWDTSPRAREEALKEWRRITTGSAGRPRVVDPMAAREAIDELRQWSAATRRIPVSDRNAWAKAASQTAGVFAAASARTERSPGPLDRLSRQLARAGQMPAQQRSARPHRNDIGLQAVARMLWAGTSPAAADMALMYALTELLLTVREALAATDRAAAAAAMASEARKALTEIHMRADGIDPTRPHRREEGSPAWAAAVRSSVVVDGLDREQYEQRINSARQAWNARRVAATATRRGEQYDEKGHVLKPANPSPSKSARRTAGPLTPPGNRVSDFDAAKFMRSQKPTKPKPMEQGINDAFADEDTYGTTAADGPLSSPPGHSPEKSTERDRGLPPSPPSHGPNRGHGRGHER
ncbi:relaxase/mobilization nuclease domain-containing protein (plasmid) [Nocardia pseudovaccinii]|uniref:relaxase/mobilization nuclease domain-containing protein n=1 Tax=Nocardia pseudovaccinii TaxID=189540 RepID=UPI003D8B228F